MIAAGNLEHADVIARAAGTFFNPKCDHVISRTKAGKLLGGVIFSGFNQASIGMSCAGFDPRWINNDMLWITFNYPFEQLMVSKIIVQVPSRNHRALDFDLKLGFKEEARVKDVFPDGEDMLVLSMRREDCRWLKLKPRGSDGK